MEVRETWIFLTYTKILKILKNPLNKGLLLAPDSGSWALIGQVSTTPVMSHYVYLKVAGKRISTTQELIYNASLEILKFQ